MALYIYLLSFILRQIPQAGLEFAIRLPQLQVAGTIDMYHPAPLLSVTIIIYFKNTFETNYKYEFSAVHIFAVR